MTLALRSFALVEAKCRGTGLNVLGDDGIRSDARMGVDAHRSQDLGSRTDVDMIADRGNGAAAFDRANRNLLKQKAIYADLGVGVDDDPVRVWNQEAPSDVAIEGDISPCNDAPEAMAKNQNLAADGSEGSAAALPILISAHSEQQFSTGVPEPQRSFS
nr:hypothetical protein [Bradyrhizobium sp. STM 3809]